MKYFLLCISIVLLSSVGFSQTLPPSGKLNRLSRVLRGHAPTDAERAALQQASSAGQVDSFLDHKIDEYLASEDHAFKMSLRLEGLFRMKSTETFTTQGVTDPSFLFSRKNALNVLFSELGRKNLTWDTLLTGKSYQVFTNNRITGFGMNDYGFLAAILPDLHSTTGTFSPLAPDSEQTEVTFAANDPRIAGAITTSRFFNRYVSTGLNKDRKRAAAIFRIFLSDSMSAAVSSSEGQDQTILDLMFPHTGDMTEAELKAIASSQGDALHGTRPDCMACHSKLDPMGRTLMTSTLSLAPRATPGRLTYKRGQGELVNIPVKGVGELGAAITQQPEYEKCQVQHFYNWFFDEKTQATPEKIATLTKEFNRVGRRTNDFIKILVHQPEFFAVSPPMTEAEMRARQVKSFFKKCQDCHKDQFYADTPDNKIPDFTQWPIGGSKQEMKSWVDSIQSKMDLKHNGEKPSMPPTEAAWRTSYKEIQLIKSWIDQGAPNETGERMIEP